MRNGLSPIPWYLYECVCEYGIRYVGITTNPEQRHFQHLNQNKFASAVTKTFHILSFKILAVLENKAYHYAEFIEREYVRAIRVKGIVALGGGYELCNIANKSGLKPLHWMRPLCPKN